MKHLVLLHGWAANGRIWEKQEAFVAHKAQVWAPDLPVWEAGWLMDNLRAFDPADTVLVGWSLGGMLALEACALGFKPRILVLVSACASFCRRPDYSLGISAAVVRGMRQRLRSEAKQVVQEFHQQLLAPGEADWQNDLEKLLLQEFTPEWLAQGLDYLRAQDLRGILPEVEARDIVLLHGRRDRIIPAGQAYYLRDQLPEARLVLLPGAGHAPMITCSSTLNEVLAEFL
ncbi:MAG: alpha/beta fold hydrolase [Deltaproteobacteria bacterium]|nr:alpha/beta fold hydrolase [Deltaproteobacteria bacterium]